VLEILYPFQFGDLILLYRDGLCSFIGTWLLCFCYGPVDKDNMGSPYIDVGYENNNINIYMFMPYAMFCVLAIQS
jgi:hypothetical protein